MLATPDKVALAERVIEANDKSKGEVVVEVRILEVDKTRAKEYGLRLSQYEAAASFSRPGMRERRAANTTSLRAHLLSSAERRGLGGRTYPRPSSRSSCRPKGRRASWRSPRLRAAEGKKTTLKIGEEIPIPVTSFTVPTAGTTAYGPATSFQYKKWASPSS